MAMRISPDAVARALANAGHAESEYDPVLQSWDPGYRCAAYGTRAVIVLHDGVGERDGLAAYTAVLRAVRYHVVEDKPLGSRHRLIVTRP